MKRTTWVRAGAAVLVAVTATAGVVAVSGGEQATSAALEPSANTMKVQKGRLSAMVSLDGTLTYRARSDGSPYSAINQAPGTYTKLPDAGDQVGCGDVLYRVDDDPVLLLCGTVPAYRELHMGDEGNDVRQLNRNLHRLGYDHAAGAGIRPGDNEFTWKTEAALRKLQHGKRVDATGALDTADAIVLPESVRIAKVTGELGGSARPGARVAQATSDTLEVQVDLDASQQGEVKPGAHARITLPGNTSVTGKVDRWGESPRLPRGRAPAPQPRRSRPTSRSTGRGRRAAWTGPRSRCRSRPRECRAP